MKLDLRKLQRSLALAFHGLSNTLDKEQNFRIELLAAIFICFLGFYFKLNITEWAWIIVSIFLVLSAELLNTAIERLTDLVMDRRKTNLAKQAKDIAAAAVLLTVFQAVIAGVYIFLPKIIHLLKN
jgi:diacylglycerol kinase